MTDRLSFLSSSEESKAAQPLVDKSIALGIVVVAPAPRLTQQLKSYRERPRRT